MIRFLLWAYLLAHLLAFWRLRRAPFQIWRWYCLAAAAQTAWALLPGMTRAAWWSGPWAYSEPILLLWRVFALVELLYYATRRLYREELVSLRLSLIYVGSIGLLIILGASAFRGFFTFRAAVQAGMAMSAAMGIWWFWRRPQAGMSKAVILHAKLLGVYLAIKAGTALTYPALAEVFAGWIVNGCYLAAISLLMVGYEKIQADRSPAAYRQAAS